MTEIGILRLGPLGMGGKFLETKDGRAYAWPSTSEATAWARANLNDGNWRCLELPERRNRRRYMSEVMA